MSNLDHEPNTLVLSEDYQTRAQATAKRILNGGELAVAGRTEGLYHVSSEHKPILVIEPNENFQAPVALKITAVSVGAALIAACTPAPEHNAAGVTQTTPEQTASHTITRPHSGSTDVQADNLTKKYVITNPVTGETVTVDELPAYNPSLNDIRQTPKSLTEEAPDNGLLRQSIRNAGIDTDRPFQITSEQTAADLVKAGKLNPNGMIMTYRNRSNFAEPGTLGYFRTKFGPHTQFVDGLIRVFGLDEKYVTVRGHALKARAFVSGLAMVGPNLMSTLFDLNDNEVETQVRDHCDNQITVAPPEAQPTPTKTATPTETPTEVIVPTPTEASTTVPVIPTQPGVPATTTSTPTETGVPTHTPTPVHHGGGGGESPTNTPTPTETPAPGVTPSPTPAETPTIRPTIVPQPVLPTGTPGVGPTETAQPVATRIPTSTPETPVPGTATPTIRPTIVPQPVLPTATQAPVRPPTETPQPVATRVPTSTPDTRPTTAPTQGAAPTSRPTVAPGH